jgi:hypothetical protein
VLQFFHCGDINEYLAGVTLDAKLEPRYALYFLVVPSVDLQTLVLLLIGIEDVLIDRLALLLVEVRRVNPRQLVEHSLNRDEDRRRQAIRSD